ncbi:hypothetical protein NW756_005529 [Fusarium oxysporum]|nr:hypothetical protein NW753_010866 [Fusarium oxysporum]KAJ4091330.1 hypothetical protein NW756_005529 [Fusarium oxysporum]KAJ4220279.1 hypothetical protein NW760_012199 [Fusarium oxysporum]
MQANCPNVRTFSNQQLKHGKTRYRSMPQCGHCIIVFRPPKRFGNRCFHAINISLPNDFFRREHHRKNLPCREQYTAHTLFP